MASSIVRQALVIKARIVGSEHTSYAASLHELGNVLSQRGRYAEAERAFQRSLAILERADDIRKPLYVAALNVEDPPARADRSLDESEIAGEVARAIDELVESRRAVVRMYLAGYEREEIASLLGWTEAKTRNLLYRGLDDLRATLTARGITPQTAGRPAT